MAWLLAGGVLLLYAVLRATAGPLPQWLDYPDFADTRVLGPIPHAGDVLTNLAILAAGLGCASLHRRVTRTADERLAYQVFALAAILTAFGSAYYHWDPSNARLVWDRLPMALLLAAGLALVLADRVTPALGRESLLPLSLVAMGGVLLWGVTGAQGRGDLWLYLGMRVGRVGRNARARDRPSLPPYRGRPAAGGDRARRGRDAVRAARLADLARDRWHRERAQPEARLCRHGHRVRVALGPAPARAGSERWRRGTRGRSAGRGGAIAWPEVRPGTVRSRVEGGLDAMTTRTLLAALSVLVFSAALVAPA